MGLDKVCYTHPSKPKSGLPGTPYGKSGLAGSGDFPTQAKTGLEWGTGRATTRPALTPLRGSIVFPSYPRACALGCILLPLRG